VRVDGVASELVQEFFERKALSELGVSMDFKTLTTWEVDAFTIISQSIMKAKNEKAESDAKKNRKRGR
jgi:hypothetical protein